MKEFLFAMFHALVMLLLLPFMLMCHVIGFIASNLWNATRAGFSRGNEYDPIKNYEEFRYRKYIRKMK